VSADEIYSLEVGAELIWQGISRFEMIEELKSLTRRLVDTEEAERRGIARELHDEIGQSLTGLKMILAQTMRTGSEIQKPGIEDAQAIVSDLIRQVRETALKLRPTMLDDLGLLPTMQWLIERFTANTQIKVHFEHTGLDNEFSPGVSIAVYRIVQEALTNVARYAGTNEAWVTLKAQDGVIYIQIKDHGRGFDLTEMAGRASTGVSGMKERAVALGGKIVIDSRPGSGTSINAEIPVL
jgi:signal transduction histidine kinase